MFARADAPGILPKMVGYPGAAPGASCSQGRRVRWLSRIRLKLKWTRAPDLHRVGWTCEPLARRLRLARVVEIGSLSRICPGTASVTGRNADC
jgi:hypothetical protein